MKNMGLLMLGGMFVIGFFNIDAMARTQYKTTIDDLQPNNAAERQVKMKVKSDKCNTCHIPMKPKKIRNEFGMKLHDALGGGDKTKYKFDKNNWKKGPGGNIPAKSLKMLRDAIKKAAEKK